MARVTGCLRVRGRRGTRRARLRACRGGLADGPHLRGMANRTIVPYAFKPGKFFNWALISMARLRRGPGVESDVLQLAPVGRHSAWNTDGRCAVHVGCSWERLRSPRRERATFGGGSGRSFQESGRADPSRRPRLSSAKPDFDQFSKIDTIIPPREPEMTRKRHIELVYLGECGVDGGFLTVNPGQDFVRLESCGRRNAWNVCQMSGRSCACELA